MSRLIPCTFEACLHFLSCLLIALKYASGCCQIVPVTCFSCIFFTVTPFGVFLICNLISFSCTFCLCYCLLLLINLKYGLGQNSTKSFNCRGVLSVMPCLGCASLKLTSIDSLSYASPLDMFVCYAMYLNNLNHRKCAVSSCVTSTPLNLLVTALDARCDVSCCLLVDACSCLLHSNRCLLVDCFPVLTVLCASADTLRRRCELAIDYTFGTRLINRQGLCITYDPFYFNQRFAC